jgi:phenylacetaldehyde dehydrogenase
LGCAGKGHLGLAAVWTKDIDKAFKFAKAIKAGTVWINCLLPHGGHPAHALRRL